MMIKNSLRYLLLCLILIAGFAACKQSKIKTGEEESVASGRVRIIADESFQPIVDEEIRVFEYLNPKAKLDVSYQTENSVLRALLTDSVRFALLSRQPNAEETKLLKERTLPPVVNRFALDAVAFIVNQSSPDTLLTVDEIKKILNGETKTGTDIVFDNGNSSLVRYLKEFAGIKDFKLKNLFAVKNNKEVIKYISQHPQAIGITGFVWLNDADQDYADALSKVKIVGVKDENNKVASRQYFKPSQSTIALGQYPLVRGLYLINCTGKMGLASGFGQFVLSQRGQRIILRSGILPDSIPPREISIKKNL